MKPMTAREPRGFPVGLDTAWHSFLAVRMFGLLDGVRALCITFVIWHHVPHLEAEPTISTRGFLGVDMFFVLSGFLIVTLILREKARTSDVNLLKFYSRGTLRIFPIYYLTLFSSLAIWSLQEEFQLGGPVFCGFPLSRGVPFQLGQDLFEQFRDHLVALDGGTVLSGLATH